jgi:hypothetical protein
VSYVRVAADSLCLGVRMPSVRALFKSPLPPLLLPPTVTQVRTIDVRFLPRAVNIGPTIAVEKPAWRIQGGFEFVLAGITITDADAAADGGLVTCAFTTTRGWWSLPSALPLILLNGATGTKDALALSFRATFANMISIIAQIRFASVSDPGEDVVIVQVCNTHTHTCTHAHTHMSLSFKCVTHTHIHAHMHTHTCRYRSSV